MTRIHLRPRTKRTAAAVAAAALGATALISFGGGTAGADPQQLTALVGVGSDTIQDVTNAFAGFTNGNAYTPVRAASGNQQLISFDAQNPTNVNNKCIAPKVSAATIYRSNGSSEGRRALSRAIDGTSYGPTTLCGGSKPVSGLIDFARSSAGPAAGDLGTDLTYIPLARDGVSFAYATNGVTTPVTSLTRAQLQSIYAGPASGTVINGVNIVPCGIQNGSGTKGFWDGIIGGSTNEAASTATCNAATTTSNADGRIEENNGTSLLAKAQALPSGTQVIAGFSAGSYTAQFNNVSPNSLPAGNAVQLGSISDDGTGANLGAPVSGTTTLTPNSAFYNSTVFGRNVYYVLDSARIGASGSLGLKQMFISTGATSTIPGLSANYTAVICQSAAQTTANEFGFLTTPDCGNPNLVKGSLFSGIQ